MTGIVSWIMLGTAVGILAKRLMRDRFPGGLAGTMAGGAAGGFLGGAIFSLAADRDVAVLDGLSLVLALAGAAAVLAVVRKADHAQPRAR